MNKTLGFIVEKLKEPSTWRGFVWLATAFGLVIDANQKEAIVTLGITLSGLISVFAEKGNSLTPDDIAKIVEKEQTKKTEAAVKKSKEKKKDEKTSDADNVFDD